MPLADLASSFNSFFERRAGVFRASLRHPLDAVRDRPRLPAGDAARARLGLAQRPARRLSRARRISFLQLAAAYLAGAGINAIVPAHAGDVTKVFLVKRQIPDSSYPAVTSSFLVQTVFDTTVGVLVLLYAISQGLLPKPPQLPHLPAFEISFWANHPQTFLIVTGVLLVAIAIGVYFLAHRVRRFWERVRQGLVILTMPRRYLREVAAWQGVGWLCRFAAFWFFLEAFGIGGSVGNVMLVMSVQAIADDHPLHARRRRRPAGAAGGDADRAVALRGPLLLGRHADRDGRLVGGARLRRDPARLPHHRLARPDPTGPGRRGLERTTKLRPRRRGSAATPAPRVLAWRAPESRLVSSTSQGKWAGHATATVVALPRGSRSGRGRGGSPGGPGRGRPGAGRGCRLRRRPGSGRRVARPSPSRSSGGRASSRSRPSRASAPVDELR